VAAPLPPVVWADRGSGCENHVDALLPPLHPFRTARTFRQLLEETDVKRIADTVQRHLRWSSGCADLELAGAQLDLPMVELADRRLVRPAYLRNRFASRGSALV
jgi:hypothetical protein